MKVNEGLKVLKSKINDYARNEQIHLNNDFQNIKQNVQQLTNMSAAAFGPILDFDVSNSSNQNILPWGFIYGYEQVPGIASKNDLINLPLIHSFINVPATSIDDDSPCAPLLLDFALRSILSYQLGDSLVYMLDSNISGDFNLLSEISTRLDDYDTEKNQFHYITMPHEKALLFEHLFEVRDNNIRKFIPKHQDLYTYNKSQSGRHEPFHFVFIRDVNFALSDTEKEKLTDLILHGNATKAGIYVFFSFHKKDLEISNSYTISANPLKKLIEASSLLSAETKQSTRSFIKLSPKVSSKETQMVINYVKTQKPKSKFVSFEAEITQLLKQNSLWETPPKGQRKYHLHIPIGFKDDMTPLVLNFPFKSGSPHGYVGGKTGCGKSTLLHNIIINGALRYSPEQLRFYLIDLKGGVSFIHYKDLPHVAALSASSDDAFALSVLEMFCKEIDRRGRLFSGVGVSLLDDYNEKAKKCGKKQEPYLLCVIDEYQRLLEDPVKSSLPQSLFRIIHSQARAFGIFLILCTQSIGNAPTDIRQVGMKMSLIASPDDSQKLIGNDAAAWLRGVGRAILNVSETGDKRQNQEFQVAFVNEEQQLPKYIQRIRELYLKQNNGRDSLEHIIYNDNDQDAKIIENPQLSSKTNPQTAKIYVGKPAFCQREHIGFNLNRESNNNIMVCGTDRSAAMRLAGSIIIQFCRLYCNNNGRAFIIDLQRSSSKTYNSLEFLKTKIPGIEYSSSNNFENIIKKVYNILIERIADSKACDGEILVSIIDIRSLPIFSQNNANMGFLDFSTLSDPHSSPEKEVSTSEKLRKLILEGSSYGIHLLVYGYNYVNIDTIIDRSLRNAFEIKIGLRGGESSSILYGINAGEISLREGVARILMPAEMGAHFTRGATPGDPFIVYNKTGLPSLESTSWGELFHNLPNDTEIL